MRIADRVAQAIRYGKRFENIEIEGLTPTQVRAALHALRESDRAWRDHRGVWRAVPAPERRRASSAEVLAAMRCRGDSIESIAAKVGITIAQARSALYRLRARGLVRHVEPGRWAREKRS